jgi:hypothetical protein
MIAQPERAEAGGNPAQTFPNWMRVLRVRISRSNNFAE